MSEIDKEVGRVDRALVNHAPTGHGPSGFDPARWGDLSCAIANARLALEFWEREAAVAAKYGNTFRGELLEWCRERGRQEMATLREWDGIIRPIAYGPPCDSGRLPEGEDPKGLSAEQARAAPEEGHRPTSTSQSERVSRLEEALKAIAYRRPAGDCKNQIIIDMETIALRALNQGADDGR